MLLELIDWTLDGSALIISLLVAKRLLDLSNKEVLVLLCSTGIYVLHEMWEAGIVGQSSHKAFEMWVYNTLT